jgi:hypothetical protein
MSVKHSDHGLLKLGCTKGFSRPIPKNFLDHFVAVVLLAYIVLHIYSSFLLKFFVEPVICNSTVKVFYITKVELIRKNSVKKTTPPHILFFTQSYSSPPFGCVEVQKKFFSTFFSLLLKL